MLCKYLTLYCSEMGRGVEYVQHTEFLSQIFSIQVAWICEYGTYKYRGTTVFATSYEAAETKHDHEDLEQKKSWQAEEETQEHKAP